MGLTISDSGPKFSNRVGALAFPPAIARNAACHCGSGSKYKRCCYEQDDVIRRQLRLPTLPPWILSSRGKLHQFEKYACHVFVLPALLASLNDTRRAPEISTFDVVNSLLHSALLRIPSLNALEGDLKESDFQKLIGRTPTPDAKAFSADVVANVSDKLQLGDVRRALAQVIAKAERNKAFREGSYGALRCVAIDGWEPFASYDRHCPQCLVRHLKVKRAGGEVEEVKQYYHRYVVAMLLGPVLDVVLAIEPLLNEKAHSDTDGEHAGHQGELTAARRLLDSLYQTSTLSTPTGPGWLNSMLTAMAASSSSRKKTTSRSRKRLPYGRARSRANIPTMPTAKSTLSSGMRTRSIRFRPTRDECV